MDGDAPRGKLLVADRGDARRRPRRGVPDAPGTARPRFCDWCRQIRAHLAVAVRVVGERGNAARRRRLDFCLGEL